MADTAVEDQSATTSNTYIIRPNFQHKFRPIIVKEAIHNILNEHLTGKNYDAEETTEWSRQIADEIKVKLKAVLGNLIQVKFFPLKNKVTFKLILKELGYDRYKFIVQVVIGEQRGEGVKMGCRCFWDSDTDNYAQDIFMNDSIFCVAAAFGCFYY